MPETVLHLPFAATKNVSRCCQAYPGKQNCSQHSHCDKGLWHGRTQGLFPKAITNMCILRGEEKIRRIAWKKAKRKYWDGSASNTFHFIFHFPISPWESINLSCYLAVTLEEELGSQGLWNRMKHINTSTWGYEGKEWTKDSDSLIKYMVIIQHQWPQPEGPGLCFLWRYWIFFLCLLPIVIHTNKRDDL